jgi:hypothetical protein
MPGVRVYEWVQLDSGCFQGETEKVERFPLDLFCCSVFLIRSDASLPLIISGVAEIPGLRIETWGTHVFLFVYSSPCIPLSRNVADWILR